MKHDSLWDFILSELIISNRKTPNFINRCFQRENILSQGVVEKSAFWDIIYIDFMKSHFLVN